jgi:sialate O-acetylesterase
MISKLRTVLAGAAVAAAVCSAPSPARAVAVDTHLFTDGLVLQREMQAPVWGTGTPGEQVTVSVAGQSKSVTTGPDSRWIVRLGPLAAGGPYTLTIQGNNLLSFSNVYIGEVWLCAGQSNMVLEQPSPVQLAANPEVHALRFDDWSDAPGDICWEFALTINDFIGVPVGIINNAKGGARIRTWMPPSAATEDPDPALPAILAQYPIWGDLWEEVTVHLVPYGIRGVIWWQGESDSRTANDHRSMLGGLIRGWRREWGQGDFPFLYIQLPNGKGLPYGEPPRNLPRSSRGNPWASVMRQAFVDTLDVEPNTAMVVTSDLIGGIHPPPQQYPEYAARLADAALVEVYGRNYTYTGPIVESATAEGSNVRVRYRPHTADSLEFTGSSLQGFALTADGVTWEWADSATIEGTEVVVSSSSVPAPVGVRYGWASRFRWANLYNERNMVSGPFQVDVQTAP